MTNMKTGTITSAIIFFALTTGNFSHAALDTFSFVYVRTDSVRGECLIGIQNEPWVAVGADCRLLESDTDASSGFATLDIEEISAFDLYDYPHDDYTTYKWNTLKALQTSEEKIYCNVFGGGIDGGHLGIITFGQLINPENRLDRPGIQRCKNGPPAIEYEVYWQPLCWGTYDVVLSLNAVFESGAISYRIAASESPSTPWLCWAIAVFGGE